MPTREKSSCVNNLFFSVMSLEDIVLRSQTLLSSVLMLNHKICSKFLRPQISLWPPWVGPQNTPPVPPSIWRLSLTPPYGGAQYYISQVWPWNTWPLSPQTSILQSYPFLRLLPIPVWQTPYFQTQTPRYLANCWAYSLDQEGSTQFHFKSPPKVTSWTSQGHVSTAPGTPLVVKPFLV